MKRKRIQFAASLLITALFLYLAFRNVSWRELWMGLRQISYFWAIPFTAVTLLSMYLRTLRWKYLLEPVVKVPSHELFSPLIICFALNSILPGRAGEFARAYLVSRDYRAPFSGTLATVIVERIADGLGLLAFFVAILAFVPLFQGVELEWDSTRRIEGASLVFWLTVGLAIASAVLLAFAVLALRSPSSPGQKTKSALIGRLGRPRAVAATSAILGLLCAIAAVVAASGAIFDPERTYVVGRKWAIQAETLRALSHKLLIICLVLLTGSILTLWRPFHRLVESIVGGLPFVPRSVKNALIRFIGTFVQGFHSLRSPRLLFWVVFHTATVWLTVGWSLVLMSYGFPEQMHLTFMQGMAVAIIICVAILIPAAPGYWGLYEVGCILALQMLGVVPLGPEGRAQALSFSLVAHFLQMLPVLLLGLWFLWRRQVGLAEITRGASPTCSGPNDK